jgi:hypothetical protein
VAGQPGETGNQTQEDTMELKFVDGATIKHLNIRKEGDEHSKEVAVDIKLSGEAYADAWIDKILGTEHGKATQYFWTKPPAGDEYEAIFTGIDTIKSWADFKECKLSFGGLRLTGNAKKFEFKPRGDLIADVTFTLSVLNPNKNNVNVLAEMVQEAAPCELEFPADLFDGNEGLDFEIKGAA